MHRSSCRMLAAAAFVLALSLRALAVEIPITVNITKPVYPPIAAAHRTSGTVLVDVEIGVEGRVIAANPITGHQVLQNAAKEAALRWRFKPAADGKVHTMRLTFIFHEVSYVAPVKIPEFTSPYQVEIEWTATVD